MWYNVSGVTAKPGHGTMGPVLDQCQLGGCVMTGAAS